MEKSDKLIYQHIDEFLQYLDVVKNLSVKSQETYGRLIKKFSDWLEENDLEGLKPHELTDKHLWDYRLFLSQSRKKYINAPLRRSTQNYYLIALRNFLAYLTERDIVSLPSEKIKLIREKQDKPIKFLNLEQVEKLLGAPNIKTVTGLRDKAILEVFFSTGMRIAELAALNREQFKIEASLKDLEISIIGKGGRIRTVYFSERALGALRAYVAVRQDKEKALFINYKGPKSAIGKRLTPRSIENLVKKYAVLSGCPLATTPHVLRNTFATDLLSKGVDVRTVQEFLGHRNIATTQIYTHVTRPHLREIHRKFHGIKK